MRRSSRSRPPSSPKSATSARTSMRSCATWPTWPSSGSARPRCSANARAPKTPPKSGCSTRWCRRRAPASASRPAVPDKGSVDNTARQVMRKRLREGSLNDKEIEIELAEPRAGLEIMTPPGMEEMAEQMKNLFSQMGGARRKARKLKIAEAMQAAGRRGGRQAGERRRGQGACPGQHREQRHRVHRRDRQDRHAAPRWAAPTCRARACSATCCRWSKARPSAPSTAWSRPTTSCSSHRARSICPSRAT